MNRLRNLALVVVAAVPFASHAADLGLAKDFNAFVFGSASLTGGHSDGSVAIGGALSGTYDAAQQSASGVLGGQTMGLYVRGSSSASGSVNNGRSYFGNYAGSMNFNGGPRGAATASMGSDFDKTVANLKSQSSSIVTLAGMYGNSFDVSNPNSIKALNHAGSPTVVGDSNNISVNLSGFTSYTPVAGQTVYLFNLNADSFQTLSNLQITWNGLDATHTLLVNVTDNDNTIDFIPKQQVSSGNHYILYNFNSATSLTVGSNDSFNGSILAPYAAVTQKRNIQGDFIAASWTEMGSPELHFDNDGNSKFLGYVPPAQAVPEPGTWAALGLGVAAMLRRRRK